MTASEPVDMVTENHAHVTFLEAIIGVVYLTCFRALWLLHHGKANEKRTRRVSVLAPRLKMVKFPFNCRDISVMIRYAIIQ